MAELTIQTERFGAIQVDEARIIQFVEPILGFHQSERYVLLDHAENSPFKWLQSADEPTLAFVVTNPQFFGMDYEFVLADEFAEKLALTSAEETLVLTIVNIPPSNPSDMTANLLGPIVINQNTRKALQVVLADSRFSTKTRLLADSPEAATSPATGSKTPSKGKKNQ